MVIDLCLDDNPANLVERRHEIFLQHRGLREDPTMAIEVASLEAQRAYLGCYLLSST
jgi:hypothetical protein